MNTINALYVIGLFVLGYMFGGAFAFWVFMLSLSIALMPLANSVILFVAPIITIIWCSFITSSQVYDSDFVWLSLLYVPFHYIGFASNIMNLVKSVFK